MKEYRTVLVGASDEFVERRSHFIGYVRPVSLEREAVDFIGEIRSKHWDATHNVYAYVLRDGQTRRYSDDGEPQGTAGMPVLDVLLKEELTDCCVVVTRYFGGVLLGTGGLVRAYSHAAKIAVESGGIVTMLPCAELESVCDYAFFGKLPDLAAQFGGAVTRTEYADFVRVGLQIPTANEEAFLAALTDRSFGRVSAKKTGENFVASEKK